MRAWWQLIALGLATTLFRYKLESELELLQMSDQSQLQAFHAAIRSRQTKQRDNDWRINKEE